MINCAQPLACESARNQWVIAIYITGRLYAYLLGLREPRFVTGYTGPEIDIALFKRELDARVTTGESIVRRSPEWLEKKLVDVHAGIEIPKASAVSTSLICLS